MKVERVLAIAPTPFFADRGSHVHIAEQAYALQRRGLEVKIATYHLGRDLHDPERRALAEQVRAKAVKDYSWDSVAGRLVEAYERAHTAASQR